MRYTLSKKQLIIGYALVVAILLGTFGISFIGNPTTVGAALPNFNAKSATTATTSVGHQSTITIFTAKELCSSRTISTVERAIFLSFDSNLVPSSTLARGILQATGTTATYDAELYGCGAVTAAAVGTTTITKAEFMF